MVSPSCEERKITLNFSGRVLRKFLFTQKPHIIINNFNYLIRLDRNTYDLIKENDFIMGSGLIPDPIDTWLMPDTIITSVIHVN